MTTKKIVLIVAGVVVVLGFVVLLFVGGIVGFALYQIGNSEKLKSDIGEVRDFGSIVTGGINLSGGSGRATINLKVIGEKKTVNASVDLVLVGGSTWRVSSASYVNDSGQRIDLLDPFDSRLLIPLLIA